MAAAYLWWIGERDPDPAMIEHVRSHVSRAFDAPVDLWDSFERPADTFDPRRKQNASGRLLRFLVDRGPVGAKV
ncbi:MAG: peptidase M54, partial [Myxococcales bacterium]